MRQAHTLGLLGLMVFLTACGGGDAGPPPPTPEASPSTAATDSPSPTAASCTLPLRYADGQSSGISMSVSSPEAVSVGVSSNECPLRTVTRLSLTVCIEHPDLSEVTGELQLANTTVTALRVADGEPMPSACLAGGAGVAVRRFQLGSPALPSAASAAGPWRVSVKDNTPNQLNGAFVAWGLTLEGFK
jgi:hypothetical protein